MRKRGKKQTVGLGGMKAIEGSWAATSGVLSSGRAVGAGPCNGTNEGGGGREILTRRSPARRPRLLGGHGPRLLPGVGRQPETNTNTKAGLLPRGAHSAPTPTG